MPGKDDTTLTITDRPEVDTAEAAADEHDTPWGLASPMRVKKRDGGLEPVDICRAPAVSTSGRSVMVKVVSSFPGIDRLGLLHPG